MIGIEGLHVITMYSLEKIDTLGRYISTMDGEGISTELASWTIKFQQNWVETKTIEKAKKNKTRQQSPTTTR